LPKGHAALAFVDMGVGFADTAAVVVAAGFLGIYGFYICITPETVHAVLNCVYVLISI
jgi:hypothetical protein